MVVLLLFRISANVFGASNPIIADALPNTILNSSVTKATTMLDPFTVLEVLTCSLPERLDALPKSNGIYALYDHAGLARYIGITRANDKGFRGRISNRHVTGSEGYSHKFSQAYNIGRMWRCRSNHPLQNPLDAQLAKHFRTLFIRKHCRATFFAVESDHVERCAFFYELAGLEAQVQAAAPASMRAWEGMNFSSPSEPANLVDELLDELDWPLSKRQALARQAALSIAGLAR